VLDVGGGSLAASRLPNGTEKAATPTPNRTTHGARQVEMVMKANNYPGTRYTINIEDFKAGRKTVLVCTNALARGLDVQAASVVSACNACVRCVRAVFCSVVDGQMDQMDGWTDG